MTVKSSTVSSRQRMLVVFGSTIALILSLFACIKSRAYWSMAFHEIILSLKINALGTKECLKDILNAKYNKTELPCRTGCVAIVTGGTRGIGAAVVKMLLQCDMDVIIGCRKIEAGEKAIEEIRQSGVATGNAKVYELNNNNLDSVKKFVVIVKQYYDKLHILVNNAAVMFTPYEETKEGFELQWGVNYLAHFLLTALLMPLLRNAGTNGNFARVINVSSCAHRFGIINFDDINYNKKGPYSPKGAYAQSKLAQVIFTKKLQQICDERHLPIQTFVVHPGMVNTDLFQYSFIGQVRWFMEIFFKTTEQGATGVVFAAVDKSIEGRGGLYLSNCMEATPNSLAYDIPVREKLHQLSLKQVHLRDFCQYL